jgi:hypothetical protein
MENDMKKSYEKHGTLHMYNGYYCRCKKCVEAFRLYHREFKRKQAKAKRNEYE